MFQKFLALALLAVLATACGNQDQAMSLREAEERVYKVVATSPEQLLPSRNTALLWQIADDFAPWHPVGIAERGSKYATAFPVSPHILMTANHFVAELPNDTNIAVSLPHWPGSIKGRIVKRGNEVIDLALIFVEQPLRGQFVFATNKPAIESTLYVIGYGAGSTHPSLTTGIVSSSRTDTFSSMAAYLSPRITTDAKALSGHSGSPVLNDRGLVVGILTNGVWSEHGELSLIVPGIYAKDFAEVN